MTRDDDFDDMDLLALVDGALDDDPAHRAAVEAWLDRSPQARARAARYRAQNQALRAAYEGRLHEAVPRRHLAALETPRRVPGASLRIAAVLALCTLGAAAGWQGAEWADRDWRAAGFVERSLAGFGSDPAPAPTAAQADEAGGTLRLDGALPMELSRPDLSGVGYRLVGERALADNGGVRLDYVSDAGRPISLFVGKRWVRDRTEFAQLRRDDVALAWWLDGPVVTTVVGRLSEAELTRVARAVRGALREGPARPPRPPRAAEDVLADSQAPVLRNLETSTGGIPPLNDPTRRAPQAITPN